jgi:uncharacterized protein (DUF1499 family)
MAATDGGGVNRVVFYGSRLAFLLAVIALLLLALVPITYRTGLLHFRTTFFYLMQPAAYVGIAAFLVSLISLLWWAVMSATGRFLLGGLIVGALMFYVPWYYNHILNSVPRIHDISTDMDNPPTFSPAVVQARAAENESNSVDYDPKVAAQQKGAYPDLAPMKTALPPAESFKRALAAAQAMSGWTIVSNDPAGGRIEARQRTLFMGFTDDFVIRVGADGSGSRIDMRSVSRQGRSDFGVNAQRIRTYMTALKGQLG